MEASGSREYNCISEHLPLTIANSGFFSNPRAESRRSVIVASEMPVALNYLVERR
jgi:hypothetical protein